MKRQPETESDPHEARPTREPMSARSRFLVLNLIMIGACAAVMSVMSVMLYRHEVQEKRDMLQVTAQSQAHLIEAVARYDIRMAGMMREGDLGADASATTLGQIIDAHQRSQGFGETGEFTLARRDGDSIVFLLRHRHSAVEQPTPVAFDSELAEPMRRALKGLSGTVIGLDYRGERVLAAHEPVAVLDLGIVAKIDLAEIRAPFIRSALIAAAVALCVVLAGAVLFIRIGNPIIVRLEAHTRDLEKEVEERRQAEKELQTTREYLIRAQQIAGTGSWSWEKHQDTGYFSRETFELLGYAPNEIQPTFDWLLRIMHPDDVESVANGIEESMSTGRPYDMEYRLTRRDGDEITVHSQAEVTFDEKGEATGLIGVIQDITERKKAEETLRESEDRYRTLYESSCDAIMLLDEERFFGCNEATLEIFGCSSREEFCSKHPADLSPPIQPDGADSMTLANERIATALEEGSNSFEWMHRRTNGEDFPAEVLLSAMELGGRRVLQAVVRDITERKQVEKALHEKRASLQMMQMVAETANEADDVDSALRAILERVCRHTGWPVGHVYTLAEDSSEQLLPTKLWYVEQPERFETFREITEKTTFDLGIGLPGRVLATRKPAWIVDVTKDPGFLRAQTAQNIGVKSGFGFPILVGTEVAAVLEFYSAETVEPDEPLLEIMAHVGTQLGRVIERKRAEESLMRQQRAITLNHRIANVFLSSPPDEIYTDALDVVLEALDSRFGFFGYIDEAGDLVCPTLTHDVWDECRIADKSTVFPRAAWGGLWGRSLTERRTMMANEGLSLPEGHVALENALAVPIVHHDTLIGQFVVANRPGGYDEYDRELLESVASQTGPVLNALLEEARQRREREQLEEQYHRAQKMEAIGTLTGGIAHDFNNILQSLLGFCTLAQGSGLDDRDLLTECLHEIEVGGKRAADMVAQLLTFSRADEVERKLCHVEPAVHEALALIRGSLPSTIEIQTEMAHDCHPVFADVTQIHRIVLNLCTNAGHAMEKDGGVLRVELRNHSLGQETALNSGPLEAGQYVLLTVEDSGPGIMPDDLERLFEPFFTTRRDDGGSGLGLSSVHGIVASLDGGIDVISKPGEGARFEVFLPRYRGVETEEAPASPPSDSHRPGPARVLLVDDEAAVARVTALALEKRGYTVDAFTSPEEAVEAFEGDPDGYTIVITDLTMPKMTGIEFSHRIGSINAKVPILLATGQLNLDASASHEIAEVIKKPFNMDNLVEMIERHCTP